MSGLFIGTYTGKTGSHGIYHARLKQGAAPEPVLAAETENPSFITSDGHFLYAACELDDRCRVESYRIDGEKLVLLSHMEMPGSACCHVSVSKDKSLLCASNFMSGNLHVFPIREDGHLENACFSDQHVGSGTDKVWQTSPHIHCAVWLPDGSGFWTSDLGADKLSYYDKVPDKAQVDDPNIEVHFPAGAGPRHVIFTPDKKLCYVSAELGNSVYVLKVENKNLKILQCLRILPEDYSEKSTTADIHLSKNGHYLYVSCRGWNSIAIFTVGADGLLKRIGESTCFGDWPRNFAISPDGKYMAIANERSGNVQVCGLDEKTGSIMEPEYTIKIPSPVCVLWNQN